MSDATLHSLPSGHSIYFYTEGHDYCTKGPYEHPSGKCHNRCKFRVPGASTIAKNDGDPSVDGLMDWAVRLDREGVAREYAARTTADWLVSAEAIGDRLKLGRHTWRDIRSEAGDRGSVSHRVLEQLSEGVVPITQTGYDEGVVEWWRWRRPDPQLVEQVVYSSQDNFAGRFDLLLTDGTLIDLKTSKWLSNSHAVQLNLYAIGLGHSGYPPPDSLAIVQVNEDGGFREVPVPLKPEWAIHALAMYGSGKEMGKAIREGSKGPFSSAAVAA